MRQPVLAVFTAAIPNEVCVAGVYPPLRNDDIENSASDKVRKEKFCAWKLLEYAFLQVFGKAMREISFTRLPNGKWACDFCYFSLSHSENMVAVALSDAPVGVDIEKITPVKNQARVANKILTDTELAEYQRLALSPAANEFLSEVWTKKESLFKLGSADDNGQENSPSGFIPRRISAFVDYAFTKRISAQDGEYFLSVASKAALVSAKNDTPCPCQVENLANFYENPPFLA